MNKIDGIKALFLAFITLIIITITVALVRKSQNIEKLSAVVSILALYSVVVVYIISAWGQHKERSIKGKEKIITTIAQHYIARYNNKLAPANNLQPNMLIGYPDHADMWLFLNKLYSQDSVRIHRFLFNGFISKELPFEKGDEDRYGFPLIKYWNIDNEIRKYYGMKSPIKLNKDFIQDTLLMSSSDYFDSQVQSYIANPPVF